MMIKLSFFFFLPSCFRNAFDEDRVPALVEDEAFRQDMHAVSSLLKMYFRELPNPLCTYQLYDQFVNAVQGPDNLRVVRMREVLNPVANRASISVDTIDVFSFSRLSSNSHRLISERSST